MVGAAAGGAGVRFVMATMMLEPHKIGLAVAGLCGCGSAVPA